MPLTATFIRTAPPGRHGDGGGLEFHSTGTGGKGYVMHGWRYTAAHQLILAGCTDAEVAAITGHKSLEMVAKYSRKASQRGLAVRAQEKRR